jgi:hypothetical protein
LEGGEEDVDEATTGVTVFERSDKTNGCAREQRAIRQVGIRLATATGIATLVLLWPVPSLMVQPPTRQTQIDRNSMDL